MKNCLKFMITCVFIVGILTASRPASAQAVIRDTEIETYMQEWFKPIFDAAGMNPDQVKIIIVQDDQINAFVAGGANIFFYTGLLQKTENPGEVIGVMAHEMGHVTGGHLIRGKEAMEKASYESILGMILGGAAAAASGQGGAIGAGAIGGASLAQRGFLANSRMFESSADQAAIKFFDRAHISGMGLETFMKKLAGQELLPTDEQSQYVQNHPLTRDRVDSITAGVDASPYKAVPWPEKWNKEHKMMIAKLIGFDTPQQVAWTYDDKDISIEAQTARAIAAYRLNDVAKALKMTDQLLAQQPQNPYFFELKGQMLMDFGRVTEAVAPYERAIAIKPDAALIRIALAHAQIETAGNDPAKLQKAIDNLLIAAKVENKSEYIHRLLATAYGRRGDEDRAKLHLAEEALLQRKYDYAKNEAEMAQHGLKTGSADWIRAGDIINYAESAKRPDGRS